MSRFVFELLRMPILLPAVYSRAIMILFKSKMQVLSLDTTNYAAFLVVVYRTNSNTKECLPASLCCCDIILFHRRDTKREFFLLTIRQVYVEVAFSILRRETPKYCCIRYCCTAPRLKVQLGKLKLA